MDNYDVRDMVKEFKLPVLIVSTVAGKGMQSIGEAMAEAFPDKADVHHIAVEDFLPQNAVKEDLERYKLILSRFSFLLHLVYRVPFFYYRKYFREKYLNRSDLTELKNKIQSIRPGTVICISHRPAFWVSKLKSFYGMDFKLWGVLGELGRTLGWKYIFWDSVDGFLSPIDKNVLDYKFAPRMEFMKIDLPVRGKFRDIAGTKGNRDDILLMCGFWGLGKLDSILKTMLDNMPRLRFHVVCGDNTGLCARTKELYKDRANVTVYGALRSIEPLLVKSASVITKPGISSILEARAANRKIFLLKGIPVAEDNNARYAIRWFGAEWFDVRGFRKWHDGAGDE